MRCFVIMPYGKTEAEQKEFTRFYKLIIKSAVDECGITCARSDIEGKGGHIMSNVIESLAEDDLVIADLSGLNWNVAYELGIRHVLHKKGTILMCNDETPLPFDIQSLNIFIYQKNWLDRMEDICDDLRDVIQNRLNGITKNDSPVHEKYSFLPENVIHSYSSTADNELLEAKEKIAKLESHLSDVYAKVESMGLSLDDSESEKEIDYVKQFLNDYNNSIYNSDAAVAKLRELMDNDDKIGFIEFLGKVLTVGYLDEIDCRNIYILCKKLDTPAINRTYLEAVTKFYPDNDELIGLLADEYSKNYHTGDKAIQMVNGIIGVIRKDGSYQLSKTAQVSERKLASFFNVYLHLKKHSELLEIGRLICQKYSTHKKILTITYRNMLSAAVKLELYQDAAGYKEKLLEIAPKSDSTHYVCYQYETAVENYPGAFEEIEKCIACDPKDDDYYYIMAGFICDYFYARDPATEEFISISESDADEYALPFIICALELEPNINRAAAFLRRNGFNSYQNRILTYLQSGGGDHRTAFPEFNFDVVDHCLSLRFD